MTDYESLSIGRRIVYALDRLGDRIFSPRYNPFYWLGTICFFLLILITVTGIYLFIFYRTDSPYETVQSITTGQWYIGGIMRSIHRYASDGLILFIITHMMREFLLGRYLHWRKFSWISGLLILMASIVVGVIGYWMVWDERAQLIATMTSSLLDDITLFIEPPPISFLSNAAIAKMVFFVLFVMHLGLSFVGISVLAGIHISRSARPSVKPPRIIGIVILVSLLLLSLIIPATSGPPADMGRLPVNASIDWFYLFIFPLISLLPRSVFWITSAAAVLFLFILPFITRSKRPAAAKIIQENCVGCEQCNKDCPYEAIRMIPRTDGRYYLFEAVVMNNRCASCGICVGSCNSRAVEMPYKTIDQIKKEISALINSGRRQNGSPRILGFVCEKGIRPDEFIDAKTRTFKEMPEVSVITFPCSGMVNHAMIEYALESGADGVFIAGCQMRECNYREGSKWTRARLSGERAPVLAANGEINYSRVRAYWLSPLETKELISNIRLFQQELKQAAGVRDYSLVEPMYAEERYKNGIPFLAVPVILLFAFLISFLATGTLYPFYGKNDSLLKFTLKYSSRPKGDCKELTEKETETKLKHMQKTQSPFTSMRLDCARERAATNIEMMLDNKKVLSMTYHPTGLKNDGPTFVYEEMHVEPGRHKIEIKMGDSEKPGSFDYTFKKDVEFKAGEIVVIDFDRVKNEFFVLGQNEGGAAR